MQAKKTKRRRAAIVGLGRIGRALFRINRKRDLFDIVAVNDINPDPGNLAYLLQYDSEYGRLPEPVKAKGGTLRVGDQVIEVFNEKNIEDVPWSRLGVDVVIDASGVHHNVAAARSLIEQGVRKVVITHSPEEVDTTLVLGANEATYDPRRHHVVASSICDAVAIAPVMKVVNEAFGLESGFVTTLHPWLSYQNLLDGPSVSWAQPGQIYHHYAIGRASSHALIPKPTSAVQATLKVLPKLKGTLRCMSFRVPTPVVGAANLYMRLKRDTTLKEVHDVFEKAARAQKWPILHCMSEPLVSVDFVGAEYSATVDHRWTDLAGSRHLYVVLWYDNEWGYSSHALHVADFITRGLPARRRA